MNSIEPEQNPSLARAGLYIADQTRNRLGRNADTDPDVKAFAAKTLPILQGHLQIARDVAKKIGAQ